MKPVFALSLSLDGISLLHRVGGGWSVIGDVALDDPNLRSSLARLRESALALSPSGAHCKIAIPNEQIRYLTIETGSFRGETRREMARAALDGATPYAVSDLVFDYAADGNLTHIAAVARDTLDEAEAFAIEHAFEPVSFVSIPDSGAFPDEPHFGQTTLATQSLGEFAVEPDAAPIVIVGNTPAIDPSAPVLDETHDAGVLEDLERNAAPEDAPVAAIADDLAPDPDQEEPHGAGVLVTDPDLPDESLDPALADAEAADDLPQVNDGADVPGFASRRPHGEGVEAAPAVEATAEPASEPDPVPEFVHHSPTTVDGSPEPDTGADNAPELETPGLEPAGASAATDLEPVASDEPEVAAEPEAEPEVDDPREAEPAIAERVTVSVAAPTLDIPDAAPTAPATPVQSENRIARFLSRRKHKSAPAKRLKRVVPPLSKRAASKGRAIPIAPPIPAPMSTVLSPEDEAQRMTVFGARRADAADDRRPRHFGLVLTAALLLILAVVAAWSTMFSDDRVADDALTGPSDPVEQAVATDRSVVTVPEGQFAAPEEPILPSPDTETALSVPGDTQDTPDQVTPETPELTDTDVAVLDALRNEAEPAPEEPPADQAATPEELEAEPEAVADSASPDEAEARYAATGIWQDAPQQLAAPDASGTDDLYVASIDSTDIAQDAVALPDPDGLAADLDLPTIGAPAEPGSVFALDAEGLVTPTPEGTLNPDGVLVYAGRPDVVPPPAPLRFRETPDEDAALALLAEKRPRRRPDNLVAESERWRLGGRTLSELQGVRPRLRPSNIKLEAERDETPTEQAVVVSRIPRGRPSGFAELVAEARASAPAREPEKTEQPAAAQASTAAATTVAPTTVAPRIPSSASVARQATLDNAINLRRVNLIGVYGTPSNRRALVRLPSGRYKKVKVGDRVDGGRIIAIGDSELRYQKGGRNLTLKMPRG